MRIADTVEAEREYYEAVQGNLGHALALVDLVEIRVEVASKVQPAVLSPAVSDISHIREYIKRAQLSVARRCKQALKQ